MTRLLLPFLFVVGFAPRLIVAQGNEPQFVWQVSADDPFNPGVFFPAWTTAPSNFSSSVTRVNTAYGASLTQEYLVSIGGSGSGLTLETRSVQSGVWNDTTTSAQVIAGVEARLLKRDRGTVIVSRSSSEVVSARGCVAGASGVAVSSRAGT